MAQVTIRASDAAGALDQVMKRLGPDAMILSTRHGNGWVEVIALPPGSSTPAESDAPEPPKVVPSVSTYAVQSVRPANLDPVLKRGTEPPAEARPLRAENLPQRLFLFGPPGAGVTLLAARIAAFALVNPSFPQPVLVAPMRDPALPSSRLADWARLLGLRLSRPLWKPDEPCPLPSLCGGQIQIVDLSDARQFPGGAQDIHDLASEGDVWLAVPSGLNRGFQDFIRDQLGECAAGIVLTKCDVFPPTEDDQSLAARMNVPLVAFASGTGLIDTLHHVSPEPLEPAHAPELHSVKREAHSVAADLH